MGQIKTLQVLNKRVNQAIYYHAKLNIIKDKDKN